MYRPVNIPVIFCYIDKLEEALKASQAASNIFFTCSQSALSDHHSQDPEIISSDPSEETLHSFHLVLQKVKKYLFRYIGTVVNCAPRKDFCFIYDSQLSSPRFSNEQYEWDPPPR